jgi:hypothetical protein
MIEFNLALKMRLIIIAAILCGWSSWASDSK